MNLVSHQSNKFNYGDKGHYKTIANHFFLNTDTQKEEALKDIQGISK